MTVQEIQSLIRQNMVAYRNTAKPLSEQDAATFVAVWCDALADVPSEAGKLAFRRALTVCHFPITPADIFDQLRMMQAQQEPKVADLWNLICDKAKLARRSKGDYAWTARLPDGRTEGQAAREKNKRLFAELPPAVQDYFGNLQALLEFADDDTTAKSYRRRDFEKFYAGWQKQQPLDPQKLPCAATGPVLKASSKKALPG